MYHCHNGKCSEMLDYTCERRCKVSYECGRKVLKLLKFLLSHQFENKIIRIHKFYILIQTMNKIRDLFKVKLYAIRSETKKRERKKSKREGKREKTRPKVY